MIEVRLHAGNLTPFAEGGLVWAWGVFRLLPGEARGQIPLYRLENARTRRANKSEIRKHFR
jgi:hypothetical protein